MARTAAAKTYSNFVAGLITEATPLNFPENGVLGSLNVSFDKKGNIRRRLGMDYESSATLTSKTLAETTVWQTQAVGTYNWNTVGGDGNTNFLVIQVDATLYYYDLSGSAVSAGLKAFTTDISAFAAPAATNIGSEPVSVSAGKGFLFVVSKKIKPFFVTYDAGGDSITNTEIAIEIRDFDGVDDSLGIDEEPVSLSTTHEYNLKNQGWLSPGASVADPITTYFAAISKYPANNKQWTAGKDSSGDLDSTLLTKLFTGNTLAPRGHYILDPFNKDRDTASGLSGITTETVTNRPGAVAFFAGRAWYSGPAGSSVSGHNFFSQIIEDTTKVGRCYQEADPTSEDISDLIDTDGGVIIIPEVGDILAYFVTGSSLIVLADNGSWEISGSAGQGFTPTDFSVSKISSIGLIGKRTLVDVEGTPIWWSEKGIYSIGRNEVTDRIEAQSLTEATIQTEYDDNIPAVSKLYAHGNYDPVTKKITWMYNKDGNDTDYRFKMEKMLELDTVTGAFSFSQIGELTSSSPYIAGLFTLPSLGDVISTDQVIEASSGDTVVADTPVTQAGTVQTKFFTVVPGIALSEWTFSLLNDAGFMDWETNDGTGVSYSSWFDTGYLLEGDVVNDRNAVYVYVYSKRTETGYVSDGAGGFNTVNPSSLYMQSRWDWSDHSNSSRFGTRQQVYRILKTYDPTPAALDFDSGLPVIVTRNKVRGHGKALHLRFESQEGKDFNMYGFHVHYNANTAPG